MSMETDNTLSMNGSEGKETAVSFKLKGNEWYKQGKYREAIESYSKAIDLEPENSAFYNNRAAAYLMSGKTLNAITDARKSVKLDPENVKALVRLGKACFKKGLLKEAKSSLRLSLQKNPTNSAARSELNEVEMTMKRLEAARESFAKGDFSRAQALATAGLRRSPESKDFILIKAECLLHNNENHNAFNLTNLLVYDYQSDTELLYVRALALYKMERYDQAIKHLSQGLQNDPDATKLARLLKKIRKVNRLKEAGNDQFKRGNYTDAIEKYSEALAVDPDNNALNAKLLCNRGLCKAKLGRNEKAVEDFDSCIEKDPQYVKAYLKRSSCLIALGGKENLDRANHGYSEAERLLNNTNEPNQNFIREIRQGKRTVKIELKKAARKDYYKILGLERRENSTQHEIKKAYRKAALKWHPDRHSTKSDKEQEDAEKQFKDVGEAYLILSDEQKKQKYDAGYSYEEIEHGGMPGGGHGGMGGISQEDLMRMFMSQMGGGRGMGGQNGNFGFHFG
eukprot:maker-scaffold_7-snap-gene-6.35-mRNA-1 protein AED:0.01 eAED:0.01 QI:125/1/1/1/1/1/3/164/509